MAQTDGDPAQPATTSALQPDTAPTVTPSNRGRQLLLVILALVVVAAGSGIGLMSGRSTAKAQTERDMKAAARASDAEDAARDRRDLLDEHLKLIGPALKRLEPVTTEAPLLASATSTSNRELGSEVKVDGGIYTVHGIKIVDSFQSIDPTRPADKRDGYRYLLVDTDYTNRSKGEQAPACGTLRTMRVVLTDRTAIVAIPDKPPIAKGTYNTCGRNLPVGRSGRWIAPILVPEHAKLSGLLIEDVYARTSKSPYNVISGKGAWMKFDETIDVGEQGDDEIEHTYGKGRS